MWIRLHEQLACRGWLPRGYAQERAWGELLSVDLTLDEQTIEGLAQSARDRVRLPMRDYHPRHLALALRIPLRPDPWLSEGELVIDGRVVFRPSADEEQERWAISHGIAHVILGARGTHADAQALGIALMVDAKDAVRAARRWGLWEGVEQLRAWYPFAQPWVLLVRQLLVLEARGESAETAAV